MHSEWKHGETKRLVERHYGTASGERAFHASQSVHRKLMIASYHASEMQKITEAVIPTQLEAITKMLLRASGNKKAIGYVRAQFSAEAHLIACAQALHSVGDIVSHVIWHGTGLITAIPDENKISLSNVISALESQGTTVGVIDALNRLCNSKAFSYLTAYVNTTKHRSIIDCLASVSMDPSPQGYGFRVESFCYKGIEYPKTWFDTVSDQYRNFVQDAVVEIGNSLNEWLSNQTSSTTGV